MTCPRCGTKTDSWPCPNCGFPVLRHCTGITVNKNIRVRRNRSAALMIKEIMKV